VWLSGGTCSRERVQSLTAQNEGVQLASQKNYVDAITKLQQAAAIDPTNDGAYWNLAMVHIQMQNFNAARDDLQRAIQINPNIGGYHEKLGTVLMELEQWDLAAQSFEHAIQVDPDLFEAYFKLGQIRERQDNPQEALQHYTESIQHGPRFVEGYRSLGRLYSDLGYLGEAVQVLTSGLQVVIPGTEDEANLHHMLGTVYQTQRNFDQAVHEFHAALDIEPGMQDALFSLGWTYGLQDNRDEARRYLKRYVDAAAGNAPAHYLKAAQDRLTQLGGP
jgi:tetratricopeptide (TPR) repeat protein